MVHPAISVIMSKLHPDDSEAPPSSESSESSGGLSVAEDMMAAFESKDREALWAAFKAGFELLESEPHEEAGHDEAAE